MRNPYGPSLREFRTWAITDVLRRNDLVGMISTLGCPDDEYHPEAKLLARSLSTHRRPLRTVRRMIEGIFFLMMDVREIDPSRINDAAKELKLLDREIFG